MEESLPSSEVSSSRFLSRRVFLRDVCFLFDSSPPRTRVWTEEGLVNISTRKLDYLIISSASSRASLTTAFHDSSHVKLSPLERTSPFRLEAKVLVHRPIGLLVI